MLLLVIPLLMARASRRSTRCAPGSRTGRPCWPPSSGSWRCPRGPPPRPFGEHCQCARPGRDHPPRGALHAARRREARARRLLADHPGGRDCGHLRAIGRGQVDAAAGAAPARRSRRGRGAHRRRRRARHRSPPIRRACSPCSASRRGSSSGPWATTSRSGSIRRRARPTCERRWRALISTSSPRGRRARSIRRCARRRRASPEVSSAGSLLARLFVRDARVPALDEPEAGLPSAQAEALLARVADVAAGRTTLVVTHAPHLLRSTFNVVIDGGGWSIRARTRSSPRDSEAYRALLAEGLKRT